MLQPSMVVPRTVNSIIFWISRKNAKKVGNYGPIIDIENSLLFIANSFFVKYSEPVNKKTICCLKLFFCSK